jgi:hypothetical protein
MKHIDQIEVALRNQVQDCASLWETRAFGLERISSEYFGSLGRSDYVVQFCTSKLYAARRTLYLFATQQESTIDRWKSLL